MELSTGEGRHKFPLFVLRGLVSTAVMRSEATPGTRPPGRRLEPFTLAVLLAAVAECSDSAEHGGDVVVPLFHSLPSSPLSGY